VGSTDSDIKSKEISFKVQIISSSTRISINSPQFKGLKNIWEYKHGGLYKYAVGNQKDLKSARALQLEFQRKGFKDAFMVTFKNGKRIPVREALSLLN
jgi:N-acetylmuramoyl-L-alanine amidase